MHGDLLNNIKLDVGCGNNCTPGFFGVDRKKFGNSVKYIVDLEEGKLPFENSSVDEIVCKHTLEHLNNPLEILDEFNRILKKGAKLTLVVPYFSSPSANVPMHKNYWSHSSIMFFKNDYHENSSKWASCDFAYSFSGRSLPAQMIDLPFKAIIRVFGFKFYETFFCYVRPVEIKFVAVK